jgi:hypothetical protein
MRSFVVVATSSDRAPNRFRQPDLMAARNIKDFLEQTGEYSEVSIYELERSVGPLSQWAEIKDSPP